MSIPSEEFDPSIVSRLACPACFGGLRDEGTNPGKQHLVCAGCGRRYPIANGIPVLIVERAEAAD